MNKELIKKYKDVFDYWLDGGKVLYKVNGTNFADREWLYMTDNNPVWNINFTYVQDDQYAEFRKVLAEGKSLEFYHEGYWNICNIHTFSYPVNQYRIKPDEPKFKVGDWVKSTKYQHLKPIKIESTYESNERKGELGLKSIGTVLYSSEVVHWKPTEGEWCWFWKGYPSTEVPQLHQFNHMDYQYHTKQDGCFNECEPFIGTLPSNLKE